MNSLVMDYLVSKGYPEAAAKFSKEANVLPRMDIDTIKERVEIRDLIYKEDILIAIEKINDLNPQVSAYTLRRPVSLFATTSIAMIIPCSCTTHISFRMLMRAKQTLQSSV